MEDSGEMLEWFEVLTSAKQGCNMSGFLLLTKDRVMLRSTDGKQTGIR